MDSPNQTERMAEKACAACSLKNRHSASKREPNYPEGVSHRLIHFFVWLASAALCFGTSIERNPIKKKGAGPLFQIHCGDKWGFMDRTGKTVVQPQFSDVGDFFDGLARVVVQVGQDYKLCFIDEAGRIAIPCTFDAALDFSEGLAPVRIGRLWGYIDRTGKMVIQPQFQGAAEISDGLGRFLLWDRIQCGRQTHTKDDAPTYAFAMHDTTFHLTSGCFAEHQRFGYVDKKGQVVIRPDFFVAEDFSEGLRQFGLRSRRPASTPSSTRLARWPFLLNSIKPIRPPKL